MTTKRNECRRRTASQTKLKGPRGHELQAFSWPGAGPAGLPAAAASARNESAFIVFAKWLSTVYEPSTAAATILLDVPATRTAAAAAATGVPSAATDGAVWWHAGGLPRV